MFKAQSSFSGIAVTDLAKAKEFYTKSIGLTLDDEAMGLHLKLPGGGELFIYEKPDKFHCRRHRRSCRWPQRTWCEF
jgi:catechol 2,3-dioxygenase-like lactoylglutathione lyase family enzyme